MLLWSIIPEEVVFEGFNEERNYELLTYGERQVLVKKTPDGHNEIVRLFSSNPHDFMDDRFAPGALIDERANLR